MERIYIFCDNFVKIYPSSRLIVSPIRTGTECLAHNCPGPGRGEVSEACALSIKLNWGRVTQVIKINKILPVIKIIF